MKRTKIVLSMLLALVLVFQLIGSALPLAFAETDNDTYEIVPKLADCMTLAEGASLTLTGIDEGYYFQLTEPANLSFQVIFEDGWSYNETYSSFFDGISTNKTITTEGNVTTFTLSLEAGSPIPYSTLEGINLLATPEKLPQLHITINGSFSSVNKEDWTEAEFELIAGTKVFESGNSYTGSGEIKGRGNSSWTQPQKPYSLKLSQKTSLLGIPATKKYAIVASYSDDSLMRNYVTYKSALAMEGFQYVPKCEFVEVYLNGTYNGVYILVERIDIESTKIDIEEATPDNLTGGYIIEKDAGDKVDKNADPWFDAPFQANPNEDLFTLKAPDVEDGMLEYLESYMQEVHDAIMGTAGVNYTDYVDSSSWADFLVLQEIAKNVDGNLKTSCYFVKERDNNVLRMDAPWDFDLAYGVAGWSNASYNNDYYDCPTGTGTEDFMVINSSCPWFQKLYSYQDFKQLVHERYTQYRQTMIPTMQDLIIEQAAYLSNAAADHNEKWFYYNNFEDGVYDFYNWLEGRLEWLDEQWLLDEPVDPPVNPPASGEVVDLVDEDTVVVYTPNEQFSGEEVGNAFDKNYGTKWCAAYTPNYVVFDIQEPAVPTRLKVTHAGGATNPESYLYNTLDFSLQVLDPSKVTDEEFLAMSDDEKIAVMNDNSNWVKILEYVDNRLDVTDDPIVSNAYTRFYRLHVTDADENQWGGPDTIRIYEIELFGYRAGEDDHTHSFGEWTVTTEPTCTEPGVETRTCECGDTETREVEALGHDYEAVVTAPTCTEGGYTTYTCSRCGDSYIDDETEALGHSYGEWITSFEPTCTDQGIQFRECEVCGQTEGRYVDAIGHNYEAVITAPTCTEGGYTTYTCSHCGDSYVEDETAPLGHSFGEWTVTTAPTCTDKGIETRTCVCGETETREVDALGHDYEAEVIEPTETEQGYTKHTCKVCGHIYCDNYTDPTGTEPSEPEVTEPKVTEPEVTEPEVTEPEVPATSKPAGENDSADTSDPVHLVLFAMLVMLSAASMVILLPKFRRED